MFQVRVNFEKDAEKREAMWEKQHEVAAAKIYNMCTDLGGFFLKVFIVLHFSLCFTSILAHGFFNFICSAPFPCFLAKPLEGFFPFFSPVLDAI